MVSALGAAGKLRAMEQRVSLITLGVADLARAAVRHSFAPSDVKKDLLAEISAYAAQSL